MTMSAGEKGGFRRCDDELSRAIKGPGDSKAIRGTDRSLMSEWESRKIRV
jgi:hypothetical protein